MKDPNEKELAFLVDGKKFKMLFNYQQIALNCGAELLYGIKLRCCVKGDQWHPNEYYTEALLSKEEIIKCLDVAVPQMMNVFHKKGTIILTDNIHLGNKAYDWKLYDPRSSSYYFRTKHFVEYLIQKGIGAVGRGITTRNLGHANTSVLMSWTWCPDPSTLLSFEQPLYTPEQQEEKLKKSKSLSDYSTKLANVADSYIKTEREVADHAFKAKEAIVRGSKIAGKKPVRRRVVKRTAVPLL